MNRNATIHAGALWLALAAAACGGGAAGGDAGSPAKAAPTKADGETAAAPAKAEPPAEAPPALPPKVAKAVELAKAISARPEDADAILARAGLDRAGLEALMAEIAADPALSAAYEAALAGG